MYIILEHQETARICKALKQDAIIPDYRESNMIRLAPVALYTSFQEVYETVLVLKKIMNGRSYNYENKKRNHCLEWSTIWRKVNCIVNYHQIKSQ
ncbi:hypothetical protein ACQKKK_04100 [Peribacillus sp. NPDC006672]|uniref:kynureninase/PvdN C-terminal domain-containing protein n=1 Tax=Peribacillus sp. NPDC006672 TaxID=3390606 RepID=UPI003CFCC5AB